MSIATGLVSLTSRASVGMLVIAGVVRYIRLKYFIPGRASGANFFKLYNIHYKYNHVKYICGAIFGQVWRSVGWRVIVLSVSLYSLLYLYERLTWTNSSKERALKQQFVDFATQRLQVISHIISSDCGQQVQQ